MSPRINRGFTLLEVLVALAILAIALAASLRAVGMLATQQGELHRRLLATWSADNLLRQARYGDRSVDLSRPAIACPQADVELVCTVSISTTPLAGMVRYDVTASSPGQHTSLAHLSAIGPDPAHDGH